MKKIFSSNNDTIFAAATPIIKSGVAVIRISGPKASLANQLLSKKITTPRKTIYCDLINSKGESFDKILALFFQAPHSFTGEDIVEIHTHGSIAVIKTLLKELANIDGFRMAEPGEFSIRAFRNGKMDLTQAEALADLIDSETDAQLHQSIRMYKGESKKIITFWREELIRIMSIIEAYIDFPDEDLPDDLIADITKDISDLCDNIENSTKDNQVGEKIKDGMNITIIGEPNSGKSSLLNLLAKREIAIVSDIAGTTRDSLEVHLDVDGFPVIIHDTAGLRDTDDKIESLGIEIAKNKAINSDLKLVIIDSSKNDIPTEVAKFIDKNTILIANKTDLTKSPRNFSNNTQVNISAKFGNNIDELIKTISEEAKKFFSNHESCLIFRARHREALVNCVRELKRFNLEKDIELAAEDLRLAANYLGSITGEIDVESILDKIFSSFCIGK